MKRHLLSDHEEEEEEEISPHYGHRLLCYHANCTFLFRLGAKKKINGGKEKGQTKNGTNVKGGNGSHGAQHNEWREFSTEGKQSKHPLTKMKNTLVHARVFDFTEREEEKKRMSLN